MINKIIIFGTGKYWNNRRKYILNSCNIVCFLDNNSDKWDTQFCDRAIEKPDNISNYEFDYVVIMCKSQEVVYNQLIGLGVSEEKIITYKQFREICLKDYYIEYGEYKNTHYDIVVISTALNYNGGTMAAIYAVKALMSKNKHVLLCSEDCDKKLIEEILSQGINLMIAPGLPYNINGDLKNIIYNCDVVMVNVFQMLPVVCKLNGIKPVLWWIHEPSDLYTPVLQEFPQYNDCKLISDINCIAVSSIPQKNFREKYFQKIDRTMAYGILDLKLLDNKYEKKTNKTIFAIIGAVIKRKAQDIFIDAIKCMNKSELEKSKFYIIGAYGNDEFGQGILQQVNRFNNVHMLGNLTRAEMEEIYPQIDIVVCPSREDPLPIVMTEAMMYRKPCIASDSTGTADYIKDGINGFVCKTEDANDLCDKMKYFINNPNDIYRMGIEARKVYEEYFTMDKFADRLCGTLNETVKMFNEKINP